MYILLMLESKSSISESVRLCYCKKIELYIYIYILKQGCDHKRAAFNESLTIQVYINFI